MDRVPRSGTSPLHSIVVGTVTDQPRPLQKHPYALLDSLEECVLAATGFRDINEAARKVDLVSVSPWKFLAETKKGGREHIVFEAGPYSAAFAVEYAEDGRARMRLMECHSNRFDRDGFRDDGRLLTPVQVADFLQVRLRRVYDQVKAGHLRAVRVGQQLRFRLQDVEAYVERNATDRGWRGG